MGIVVALANQTAIAGQQPEEAKAESVLAEARKALGGADKLSGVKTLQVNGTTKRANGNFNLEGDTELFFELPDKFRRNESLTIGGGTGIDRKDILNGNEFSSEVSALFLSLGSGLTFSLQLLFELFNSGLFYGITIV